jgi:4-oxalocrotonate tautomerase
MEDLCLHLKNTNMPYINIRVTDEGVTKEQKRKLIEGATKLVVDILNKDPQSTHVVIDEVNTDNWGFNGEQTSERRKSSTKR